MNMVRFNRVKAFYSIHPHLILINRIYSIHAGANRITIKAVLHARRTRIPLHRICLKWICDCARSRYPSTIPGISAMTRSFLLVVRRHTVCCLW